MQFSGILKHNSVFVTDESSESLQEQGFGAKLLRPIVQRDPSCVIRRVSKKKMLEMQQQMLDDETGGLAAASLLGEEDDGEAVDSSSSAAAAAVTTTATPSIVPHMNISRPANADQSAPLLLFDEEAFYLFVNKHLVLKLPNGKPVTTNILWQKFSEKNNQFAFKYKVYAFFRDQGFVVKTGVHYGLDYAVYRTLPTLCHSEMCAMVIDATQPLDLSHLRFSGGLSTNSSSSSSGGGGATGISSHDASNNNNNHNDNNDTHEMMDIETIDDHEDIVEEDEFTRSTCQQGWRHLSTLTRVMPDVMKLLTLCYVLPATFVTRSPDAGPAVLSMKTKICKPHDASEKSSKHKKKRNSSSSSSSRAQGGPDEGEEMEPSGLEESEMDKESRLVEGGEEGEDDGHGSKNDQNNNNDNNNDDNANSRTGPLLGVAPTMDYHEVFTGAPGCPDKAIATSNQRNSFWNFGLWNSFTTNTNGQNDVASRLAKIDFSSPTCLDLLTVRPVSVLVRRLPACTQSYQTVGDIQEKYRSRSILKTPRQSLGSLSITSPTDGGTAFLAVVKKKRKKRRDHTELRTKRSNKHAKMWKSLKAPTTAIIPVSREEGGMEMMVDGEGGVEGEEGVIGKRKQQSSSSSSSSKKQRNNDHGGNGGKGEKNQGKGTEKDNATTTTEGAITTTTESATTISPHVTSSSSSSSSSSSLLAAASAVVTTKPTTTTTTTTITNKSNQQSRKEMLAEKGRAAAMAAIAVIQQQQAEREAEEKKQAAAAAAATATAAAAAAEQQQGPSLSSSSSSSKKSQHKQSSPSTHNNKKSPADDKSKDKTASDGKVKDKKQSSQEARAAAGRAAALAALSAINNANAAASAVLSTVATTTSAAASVPAAAITVATLSTQQNNNSSSQSNDNNHHKSPVLTAPSAPSTSLVPAQHLPPPPPPPVVSTTAVVSTTSASASSPVASAPPAAAAEAVPFFGSATKAMRTRQSMGSRGAANNHSVFALGSPPPFFGSATATATAAQGALPPRESRDRQNAAKTALRALAAAADAPL